MIQLPRLYCIVHSASFPSSAELVHFSTELVGAGCTLVQYRNKNDSARLMLEQAREIKQQLGSSARLIMNDRADLCLAADFDGAHVGQDDLSPESHVLGEEHARHAAATELAHDRVRGRERRVEPCAQLVGHVRRRHCGAKRATLTASGRRPAPSAAPRRG